MITQETAQIQANMNVVHNILNAEVTALGGSISGELAIAA